MTHFQTYTTTNRYIYTKSSLSSSEWTAAIKLNVNYANPNGVPGSSNTSNFCRRCNRQKEIPSHVIGSCPFNSTQIIICHHRVKHTIKKKLEDKGFECFEEVHAYDSEGNNRFSDIIAFDKKTNAAYIIDPTVRFETNDPKQDEGVQAEEKSIYESCAEYYENKYSPKYGVRNWEVIGLWFGRRGTIGNSVIDFFNRFKLNKALINEISEQILIDSIRILHLHIYS